MTMLHDVRISARALREISEYIEPFEHSADVMLLRCGEDVLVGQGDDRSVFDAKGDRRDDDGTIGTYDQVKAETRQRIMTALNRAADDVLTAIDAPDEGTRDAVNLVVNAAMTYLEDPDATLDDAIAGNYELDEGGDGPIEWAQR